MKAHFVTMAAYNRWANKRLYGAVAELGEDDFRRDVGAFFGSLCGTLNHLYVTDLIWMSRFRGESAPPWTLDHVPHPDFAELKARRRCMDCDICGFVQALDEADLEAEFHYRRVSDPTPMTQRRGEALAHFFNHQTHHRGHAHAILSILGHAPPPLDLLVFQRGG